MYFTKPSTSIVAPGGDVLLFPQVSTSIDYEVELAVIIGKPGRIIAKEAALDHVLGYTILNDITRGISSAVTAVSTSKARGLMGPVRWDRGS